MRTWSRPATSPPPPGSAGECRPGRTPPRRPPSHRRRSGPSSAERVGRVPERGDRVGLRGEPFQVVDESIPAVLGVLVVNPDVDRFLGADFLAVAAEDAPKLIDLVDQRVAIAVLVFPWDQLDAVG